jgi:hypothetical protein
MVAREVMSTHVAAKAVPYLVLLEYYNLRGRYLCDRVKSRSRSTSQFQLIVWRNVNHLIKRSSTDNRASTSAEKVAASRKRHAESLGQILLERCL